MLGHEHKLLSGMAAALVAFVGSERALANTLDPRAISSRNPAIRALDRGASCNITLAEADFNLGNNALTARDVIRLNGAALSQEDKNRLLASIPAGGLVAGNDIRFTVLGFNAGRVGIGLDIRNASRVSIPIDMLELMLNGNQIGRAYYAAPTKLAETWTVAVPWIAFGHPIQVGKTTELALGLGVKCLAGLSYGRIDGGLELLATNASFRSLGGWDIRTAGWETNPLKVQPSGYGFAADIGVGLRAGNLLLETSLNDLSPGIRWQRRTQERTINIDIDGTAATSSPGEYKDTTAEVSGFNTPYPSMVSASATWQPGKISAGLRVCKGLIQNIPGSRPAEISVNSGYRLGFLGLGAGAGYTASSGMTFLATIGAKLGPLVLRTSASSEPRVHGTRTAGFTGSVQLRFGSDRGSSRMHLTVSDPKGRPLPASVRSSRGRIRHSSDGPGCYVWEGEIGSPVLISLHSSGYADREIKFHRIDKDSKVLVTLMPVYLAEKQPIN